MASVTGVQQSSGEALTEENGERERQQLNHALGVNYIKIIGHLKSNGNFEVPYAQVM